MRRRQKGSSKGFARLPLNGTLGLAMLAAVPALADNSADIAPIDGWASQAEGTTGGSAATSDHVYTVHSVSELLTALKNNADKSKIIKVAGTMDMSAEDNGGPFISAADQKQRNVVVLPSNTTLIGVGNDATFLNASLLIKKVKNVIVRNLTIVNPCDIAPVWDPNDGAKGNWNSAYDGISVQTSRNVWIDHNVFTDAPLTDDLSPVANGKIKQCHDGALDVKSASDYVTVSYNVFSQHEKNNLIGSSDSAKDDDGHLRVTFHHNHFSQISERAPRVRFGRVHVYNNYYEGARTDQPYPASYSIGVGYKAKIMSQTNAFDIDGAKSCKDVVKNPGSSSRKGAISDSGSLLNGGALNLASACSFSSSSWTIPYPVTLTAPEEVKGKVQSEAGVGVLTVE